MIKRNKNGERGQSLVEFALTLPLLILILSGLIDIGRVYFIYIALEEAAAEAALYLSINPTCVYATDGNDCADPNNALWRAQNSYSTQGIVDSNLISIVPGTAGENIGDTVTVIVSYPFEFITPGIQEISEAAIGSSGLDLSVTATHIVLTE